MATPYVAVVGNVCSGKTTFVNKFAKIYSQWRSFPENMAEIVWLKPAQALSAFHVATFFLGYYSNHHLQASRYSGPLIQESCLLHGSYFPKAYHQLGYFSDDELHIFRMNYAVTLETLPQPDFYIYLHAPLEVLLARAAIRDEPNRTLSMKLIPVMQEILENWLENHPPSSSVVKLDTSLINFLVEDSIFEEIHTLIGE